MNIDQDIKLVISKLDFQKYYRSNDFRLEYWTKSLHTDVHINLPFIIEDK